MFVKYRLQMAPHENALNPPLESSNPNVQSPERPKTSKANKHEQRTFGHTTARVKAALMQPKKSEKSN
jgi:hypothetical protein